MSRIQIIGEDGLTNQETTNEVLELIKGRIRAIFKEVEILQADINLFVAKYNISSEQFWIRFEQGDMGDEEDFFVWHGSMKLLENLNAEKLMLRNIL